MVGIFEYLQGREPRGEEILGRPIRLVQIRARAGGAQAPADALPPVPPLHSPPEPAGVVLQLVLRVGPVGGRMGRAVGGDGVDEDHEPRESENEEEHGGEVEEEETRDAPEGADDAGEGDDEEGDTEDEDGPLEELDAGVGCLSGEPGADDDDGDGEQDGEEVDGGEERVVESHYCRWGR